MFSVQTRFQPSALHHAADLVCQTVGRITAVGKTKGALALILFLAFQSVQAALIPSPPAIRASAYIVMDAATGTIVASKNERAQIPPASLTKMMTSYIVDYELNKGNIGLDDLVLVSEKAWRMGGSRMFIREGTQVRLEDLLRGIIIQSGNDASVAVAEHIAGSERAFADLMNQHAGLLGMRDSQFQNATGLPAQGHYSTAYDLAILGRALITKFPKQYGIYSEKYFTYNNIRQPNRNRLLWRDKTVDGIKTGHTDEAGYCLVASAERDGMRLISVVVGTDSEEARAQESQKVLSYGFRYYRTHHIYKAGEEVTQVDIWGGAQDKVRLGVVEPLEVTMPRGQQEQLAAEMNLDRVIRAPIRRGDQLGTVSIQLEGEQLAEVPLVALEDIPQAGFVKRISHEVLLFVKDMIGDL